MGEYAKRKSDGQEIKIGTCESMYYLRADQRDAVEAMPGNVHPIDDAEHVRFRFPFPDEDKVLPGEFANYDRGVIVPHLLTNTLRALGVDFDHRPVDGRGCMALRGVEVVQQRKVAGKLIVVCRCVECGALFRLPTVELAAPVIKAFMAAARQDLSHAKRTRDFSFVDFCTAMAERVLAGYGEG